MSTSALVYLKKSQPSKSKKVKIILNKTCNFFGRRDDFLQ